MTFRIGQTAAQQLILDRLAWHANKDDIAWPSVELLMTETPITSAKTISTSIAFWEKVGAITLVQRANQYRRSEYRLNMSASVILTEHPPKITDAASVILSSASVIPSSASVIYDPAIKEGTVIEPSTEPSVVASPTKRRTPRPAWEPPEFWIPLTALDGYESKNFGASASKLKAASENNGVSPLKVTEMFVEYWPTGKALHAWVNPVKALMKSLDVQISKAKRRGSPSVNGRHPADRGMITQADIERTKAEDKNRPPPAKVNS